MLTDKEAKKKYSVEFQKNPDKYYAIEYLKKEGFSRSHCSKCNRPFWSTVERDVCGDPSCGAIPFSFIGDTPAKKPLDYIQVWKKFSSMFRKFGYTSIKRYPIVARWNQTMEYTNSSISAFQPYVISGEAEPPAKRLIIPQLCFRTVDIDNVGITGSHNTVFSMIGQHMFLSPSEWDQNLIFSHIHTWLKNGLGLPNDEITFHEDAWAGGGNLGPCMEFFSRGCELGNQVYMIHEHMETGIKPLNLKVLDMGMGQERNAWFSQGANTQYDASFPTAIGHILKNTGIRPDKGLIGKYVPYGGLLNIDEIENVDDAWKVVAKKTGYDVQALKENVLPLAGVYSIAEHSRALLVMFSDGALPSNIGDSYNLRIILRRMLGFVDKYGWSLDIHKLFEIHARYLKPQFPELSKNLGNATKIFEVEKTKYEKTKEKSKQIVIKNIFVLEKNKLGETSLGVRGVEDRLIKLYDSYGIPPELIAEEAKKRGIEIKIPENFYSLISERHEKREQKHATKKEIKIDFGQLQPTRALYFEGYKKFSNIAKVLKIRGNYVILDQTVAYPTSGGQMHDNGAINGEEFIDVFKQGSTIIHKMKTAPSFMEGNEVEVSIDSGRRMQLTIHHTATHIINEAARRVLGNHINQASAFKDVDKSHIDVTHYQSITDKQLDKIEKISNSVVKRSARIEKIFLKRGDAEKKYGTGIYQGGVAPGKYLRLVNIVGIDVEACGGTHLDNTKEIGKIIIVSSERVQDNISRITFVAGKAADNYQKREEQLIEQIENILGVKGDKIVEGSRRLFGKWKSLRKEINIYRQKKNEMLIFDIEKDFIDNLLVRKIDNADLEQLQSISKALSRTDRTIILLGLCDRINVFVSVGEKTKNNAIAIMKKIFSELSGKGGGNKHMAKGVCLNKDKVDQIIAMLKRDLQ